MNELSKNLLCVYMRSGVEIWVEKDRAENFIRLLGLPNAPQFTEIDGNLVNRADITGIFTALAMEDMKRRKNGEWQCKKGTWHERKGDCACHGVREEWTAEGGHPFPEVPLTPEQQVEIDKVRAKWKPKSL